MVDNKTLGGFVARRCKQKRREAGITRADLGRRIFGDVSNPSIRVGNFENRKGAMNLLTLWRLAEGLGVDWRELLPSSTSIKKGLKDEKTTNKK